MNQDKFEHSILKHTNDTDPPHWELLDKTGASIVECIVEDKDQGPSKEWGPYGWYCEPLKEDTEKGTKGKVDSTNDIYPV